MNKEPGARPLILGTRGSDLALTQAEMVRAALEAATGRTVETRVIKTTGDRRQDLRLRDFSTSGDELLDKGIFTVELEEALRAKEIDAAVHSLKDVPSELDKGFVIAGVLPRAAVEDVLISKDPGGLAGLPTGARVATGSVRRQRLLEHARPDIEVVEIRGNVPTRIRKFLEQEGMDALVLARAGLERLGQSRLAEGILSFEGRDIPVEILECEFFPPAAGQGIVALEIRSDDPGTAESVAAINDGETFHCAEAERCFLRLLDAGCQTPVGVHTWIDREGDVAVLHMKAILFSEQDPGGSPRRGEARGNLSEPEAVAQGLFEAMK